MGGDTKETGASVNPPQSPLSKGGGGTAEDLRVAEVAVCGAADDYLTAWGDQTNLDVSTRMQYLFKRVREWRLAKIADAQPPPVTEKVAGQLAEMAELSQRMTAALSDVLVTIGEMMGEGGAELQDPPQSPLGKGGGKTGYARPLPYGRGSERKD